MAKFRVIDHRIELGSQAGGYQLVGLVVRKTDSHQLVDDFKQILETGVDKQELLESLLDTIKLLATGGWVSMDDIESAFTDAME